MSKGTKASSTGREVPPQMVGTSPVSQEDSGATQVKHRLMRLVQGQAQKSSGNQSLLLIERWKENVAMLLFRSSREIHFASPTRNRTKSAISFGTMPSRSMCIGSYIKSEISEKCAISREQMAHSVQTVPRAHFCLVCFGLR